MTIRNTFIFDDLDHAALAGRSSNPLYHAGFGAITPTKAIKASNESFLVDTDIDDNSVDKEILSLLDTASMRFKPDADVGKFLEVHEFKDAVLNPNTKVPKSINANLKVIHDDIIPVGSIYITKGDACTGCLLKKNDLYGIFCLPDSVLKIQCN